MRKLSVYDLHSREIWQELLDEMQSSLGLPASLVGPDNIILQSSGERNELCQEIRGREKALPVICGQSQQFMAKLAQSQKNFVLELCEAGMAKLVVPVFRDQEYLGTVTACGCLLPGTEIERYLIEKTADIDENTIAETAAKVPIVRKEKIQNLAEDLYRRLNPS
jgi:ligand-binding sensor protein